jgi:hypothetical protein
MFRTKSMVEAEQRAAAQAKEERRIAREAKRKNKKK